MRRKLLVLLLGASLLAAPGCGGGQKSVLEEGPRFPAAEGVATEVTLERIQIDGKRSYALGENVESFTTRSHEITPLLTWKGKYIHLGLDKDRKVVWVAGIGTVVKSSRPYTLYTGVFEKKDATTGRAVFEDGTTLAVLSGLKLPRPGESVVMIDPAEHRITKIDGA